MLMRKFNTKSWGVRMKLSKRKVVEVDGCDFCGKEVIKPAKVTISADSFFIDGKEVCGFREVLLVCSDCMVKKFKPMLHKNTPAQLKYLDR